MRPLIVLALAPFALAQTPSGAEVYVKACAQCHDVAGTRAPTRDVMKQMSASAILRSMENGVMLFQTTQLTKAEKVAVSEYISARKLGEEIAAPKAGFCDGAPGKFEFDPKSPSWIGWGPGDGNGRYQKADFARLSEKDLPKLKLKWALGYPGDRMSYSQPAVAGGRLFTGSPAGKVYSVDAKTGCIHWIFQAEDSVRAAIQLGRNKAGQWLAYFGDGLTNTYAVDAATGRQIWKATLNPMPYCRVTGGPALHAGRLFVPTSCPEDVGAMNPKHECCKSRGSVASLDAETGRILWQTFTTDEPKQTGVSKAGVPQWGPSGASVWGAVTVDPDRKLVYAGTGNNHSNPPTKTSDAILALDMNTGKIVWSTQLWPGGDAWNMACGGMNGANCPDNPGVDYDIGSAPILRKLGGKTYVIAGQKSGQLTALDPDKSGEIVWKSQAAKGGKLGGIEWGPAADEEMVYVPVSDALERRGAGGGVRAIRIRDGESIWFAPPVPCGDRKPCIQANPGAATAIPGLVFAGAMDGILRAYSANDGKVLWEYDTVREFDTVNGIKARGGSLNGPGVSIVNGMVFVNSGYGMWGGSPGNVLLAFGLD
jgi:polyvinyl alcohol dehydrogenase (cytochrome)